MAGEYTPTTPGETDSKTLSYQIGEGQPTTQTLPVVFNAGNAVNSAVYDKRRVWYVILAVNNGSNQNVVCQPQGSEDIHGFANVYNIGNTFTVNAKSTGYVVVSEPWPALRLQLTPAGSITAGAVTVRAVDGVGGRYR